MHFTLFTRENLHKWGIVESDICVFCHEEIDMIHIRNYNTFIITYLKIAVNDRQMETIVLLL